MTKNLWSPFFPSITVIFFAVIITACKGGGDPVAPPPPPPLPDTVSFGSHIIPLFNRYSCLACHGTGGGLALNSVQSMLTGGSHGPAVIPNNADSSILIQKVNPNPPFGDRMPEGGPFLTSWEVELIRRWINQGARNN